MRSRRQPSPGILQNFNTLEENLRCTAKELKVARGDVAGLKRERAVLKTTIDRLQSDVDSSSDEVGGLKCELAGWQEQYALQCTAGAGANSVRHERRVPEPKLRPSVATRESARGSTTGGARAREAEKVDIPTWPKPSH